MAINLCRPQGHKVNAFILPFSLFSTAQVQIVSCECPGKWSGERCEKGPCESNYCSRDVQCNLTADGLDFVCGPCPTINGVIYIGDGITCTRTISNFYFVQRVFTLIKSHTNIIPIILKFLLVLFYSKALTLK